MVYTRYFFLFFFLVSGNAIFAQYKNIDSLKTRLPLVSGKEKADVLTHLIRSVYKKDPAGAQKYIDELQPLAKSLNYEKALINGVQIAGRIDLNKKDYDNALLKLKEAKDRSATIKDTKLLMEAVWLTGVLYSETGKITELNALFDYIKPYTNQKDGMDALARLHKHRGIYYYGRSNFKNSKEDFSKAYELFKKLNDPTNSLGLGMNVGIMEFKGGEIKKSIATYEALLPEIRKVGDTLLIADCLTNIAISEFQLGNNDKSIAMQEEANRLYLLIKNNARYQSGIMNMSSNLMSVGKSDLALKYLLSSLEAAKKRNDDNAIVLCYRNLADLNFQNNDTVKGMQYLNDGLAISVKNKFLREEASFLRGLGQIETHRKQFDLSYKHLVKSESIFASIESLKDLESTHIALGNLYLKKKEYEKAEEYYVKSLESAKKSGTKHTIAGMYSNLGVIYYEQGILDKSIEYCLQALEIRKQINSPFAIADSYLTLSNSYYSKRIMKRVMTIIKNTTCFWILLET